MKNFELARLFDLMGDVLEIKGDNLAAIELGVATARRAWVDKAGVINTWPVKKLLAWAHPPHRGRDQRSQAVGEGRADS